ncbi:ABC transporter permease [Paenibacillus sp. HB172176]|uniref:ABC transporter permease n=1 Tax=Paenibacillus sp. HB172176 TaxID=2493690 RepID=UPI001F0DCDD3|nr:ABC transporter permease [Paenibacillus sp. HB172176]
MSKLSHLIRNENMKIYRRPRTWAMVAILLLAVSFMSGVMKWDSGKTDSTGWEQRLTEENANYEQTLTENTDLGEGDQHWMQEQLAKNDYYIEHGINPYELNLWNYVNSSASLIILVTLLTVVIAADMIAAEFSWGTVKLLLVAPASRTKILLSKYIATLAFALLLLLLCFGAAFGAGGLLEGFGGVEQPYLTVDAGGAVHEGSMLLHVFREYGLSIISLFMYVTMAFMISAAFRSSSMAIAMSLLFMLIGNALSELLSRFAFVKYLLFSNIDLTQYMDGRTPLRPDMTLGFSIAMLVAYYVVFQLLAWLLFTKRDVAA